MKLKYKKMILMTAMSTMGIGILTLSISQEHPKAEESLSTKTSQESEYQEEGDLTIAQGVNAFAHTLNDGSMQAEPSTTPTPSPTPSPTPTPLPVYDMETEEYPEIEAFFNDYYVAKVSLNEEHLKTMLSDPSKVKTKDQLAEETKYIEDYRNIKCYVKKGYIEGTYIVHVYHEAKIKEIVTLAPGLDRYYLVTDSDGSLKLYSGEMDSVLKGYLQERLGDPDVIALMEYTEEKCDKAKESDSALKQFWDTLDSIAEQAKTTGEGDSGE